MNPEVYEPREDSHLLQREVRKRAIGRVLDMGTGLGIQALTAVTAPDVREVLAVDINEDAVEQLSQKIKQERIRKIKPIKGDLFENVYAHFNTVIFNPPYLPQDEGITDPALYGGKHGWEIIDRFFDEVSRFLFPDGKILLLFSTLTNKEKVEELIQNHLFEFEELSYQKLSFETLYVYEVKKIPLLRDLEKRGIYNISYFTKGKRGVIYTGLLDRASSVKNQLHKKYVIKVGIKVKREGSTALNSIENEARWLALLNKHNIGPTLLFEDPRFVIYQFIEGKPIMDWIQGQPSDKIKGVLQNLLKQCLTLDQIGVNKEEMHHPYKHVIVDKHNIPHLLDFERCSRTEKPKNTTQFLEFLCRIEKQPAIRTLKIPVAKIREIAKDYKNGLVKGERVWDKIWIK